MKRSLAAWFAIVAMALNALWPLIANAGPVEFSVPVCTTGGSKVTPAGNGLPVSPTELRAPHCPFCGGAGGAMAALAAAPSAVIFASTAHERLASPVVAPSYSFDLIHAPPRGPPVSFHS